jgi:hypothetical protein
MAIARLIALIILVPFLAAVGSGNNTAAAISAGLLFIAAPVLYFLPSIEAKLNESENFMSVLMVNLFLGWTLVGWVVALAWAHKKPAQQYTPVLQASPPPASKAGDEKVCPYCAEVVKAAAIKCRHCGSALS